MTDSLGVSHVTDALNSALENICRGANHVAVVMDRQDVQPSMDHIMRKLDSLGVEPLKVIKVHGSESIWIDHHYRISFFTRRSVHRAIRGYTLDMVYILSSILTLDLEFDIRPALTADGELITY